MLGRGYISHYSEYALSSTLSKYSTLIAFILREYDAAFLCYCLIYLFYDGAGDMPLLNFFLFYGGAVDVQIYMSPSDKKSM